MSRHASPIASSLAASVVDFTPIGTLAADEVVIGASIPLSGPLAGFGAYQTWGYETAVNDLNKAGGVLVDGKKPLLKLVIRDAQRDHAVEHGRFALSGSAQLVRENRHLRQLYIGAAD